MDLETISNLYAGVVLLGGATEVGIAYFAYRLLSSVNRISFLADRIQRDTTKFLNAFTEYIAPRLSKPEEINSMREFVRKRVESGL